MELKKMAHLLEKARELLMVELLVVMLVLRMKGMMMVLWRGKA
jgi:hypothetical protein